MKKNKESKELLLICKENKNNMQRIRELINNKEYNLDINYQDEEGNTALTYACKAGRLHLVKYFLNSPYLKENANPLILNNNNDNILMWSVSHPPLLIYLLNNPIIEKNVDIFQINKDYENAFMLLCDFKYKNILENLIINKNLNISSDTIDWLRKTTKSTQDIYFDMLDIIEKRNLYINLNNDLNFSTNFNKKVKI